MAYDLRSARHWAQQMLREALGPGARAIDATMGNGKDTAFLAELVGAEGRVYAFDVQSEAVERTRALLSERGLLDRTRLFCAGHQLVETYVPEPVDAAVFNLGWLPGGGREVTTRVETTLAAVNACLTLLKRGGLMTICAYPGHEEGERERLALEAWARSLAPERFDALIQGYVNRPNHPPQLFCICRLQ